MGLVDEVPKFAQDPNLPSEDKYHQLLAAQQEIDVWLAALEDAEADQQDDFEGEYDFRNPQLLRNSP